MNNTDFMYSMANIIADLILLIANIYYKKPILSLLWGVIIAMWVVSIITRM